MASAKDDASTDIVASVKSFIVDMNNELEKWAKARDADIAKEKAALAKAAKGAKTAALTKPLPRISLVLDPNKATECRSPAEQAEQVAAGRSWVCWSAHMADRARHVLVKVDDKVTFAPEKALGEDFKEFKNIWAKKMKANGLKNHKGKDGWGDGDAFHLEMDAAKIGREDVRAQSCIEEYVRMTRKSGKKNDKFEKAYSKDITKYELVLNKQRDERLTPKGKVGP